VCASLLVATLEPGGNNEDVLFILYNICMLEMVFLVYQIITFPGALLRRVRPIFQGIWGKVNYKNVI